MLSFFRKLPIFSQWLLTLIVAAIIGLALSAAIHGIGNLLVPLVYEAEVPLYAGVNLDVWRISFFLLIPFSVLIIFCFHLIIIKWLVSTSGKSKTKNLDTTFIGLIFILCLIASSIIGFHMSQVGWAEASDFSTIVYLLLCAISIVIDWIYFRFRLGLSA